MTDRQTAAAAAGTFTDIHTHILPGLDDGASSLEESLEMIELACRQGIRRMIATPHFSLKWRSPSPDTVRRAFAQVSEAVRERFPGVELALGNELYFSQGCLAALKDGRAFTLAGSRYILTEFSTSIEWNELAACLRMIPQAGYRAVIAHAERYGCLWEAKDRFLRVRELGAYVQINARSFTGGLLDPVHVKTTKLLTGGLVDFIASDCHDTGGRAPLMADAVEKLQKKTDGQRLKDVLYKHPDRLFDNDFIREEKI